MDEDETEPTHNPITRHMCRDYRGMLPPTFRWTVTVDKAGGLPVRSASAWMLHCFLSHLSVAGGDCSVVWRLGIHCEAQSTITSRTSQETRALIEVLRGIPRNRHVCLEEGTLSFWTETVRQVAVPAVCG